jgi:hypothetical protein
LLKFLEFNKKAKISPFENLKQSPSAGEGVIGR